MYTAIAHIDDKPMERKQFWGMGFLREFYQRNLFERVIVYIFLSNLLVKIIFELALGQWSFLQSQNKQWFFFIFLATDYLLSINKLAALKVTLNITSLYAVILLIMVFHGLFVGISNHNAAFTIFNDTIPLLMISLNILRFQSISEYKPIDYKFLLLACTYLSLGSCFFGYIAILLGKPSAPTVGSIAIFLPLLLSTIFCVRPLPKWIVLIGIIMLSLTISEMNRTTLAFVAISLFIYAIRKILKRPATGLILVILIFLSGALMFFFLPENSGTYRRIVGLYNVDLNNHAGSIGERQAEMQAVQEKLDTLGTEAQWLGLGFGGVYEVQFTHVMLKDYGHAHYSWVWFNLRFGRIGYLYLFIMIFVLVYNVIIGLSRKDHFGIFISLLCFNCLVYCLTYVNSVFLLSGIPFFYLLDGKKNNEQ
ncbi:MAG: hypothetical protein KA343_05225 [Nitrosomonas sp.]|nr:hypothetical protein [Nitrosomonas sp.]